LGIGFMPIDPVKALYWSAVLNGLIALPIMVMMMLMATNQRMMRQFTISRRLLITGWASTVIMTLASLGLLLAWGSQKAVRNQLAISSTGQIICPAVGRLAPSADRSPPTAKIDI
jgi:hypothetical protein